MTHRQTLFAAAAMMIAGAAEPAAAYVGPGAGLGAIVTVIGLALAFLLLLVGFVWFPVKRMLRKRAEARAAVNRTERAEGE